MTPHEDAKHSAGAALAALRGWAARRERLSEDRADLMAAAWWSGIRTITDLATAAGVSRDTAYTDLRARGIEPTDRTAAASRLRRFAPLTAQALHELAALSNTVVLPALLTENPGPLAEAAGAVSVALERMADLLAADADVSPDWPVGREELAQELAARLRTALHHAHAVAAESTTRDRLAAQTLGSRMGLFDDGQALPGGVSIDLYWPDGDRSTVRIEHASFTDDAPAGWTLLHSDRAVPELTGVQHLAIQTALETLAETLGRHLHREGKAGDDQATVSPMASTEETAGLVVLDEEASP
ncbi:hypothetical protein [Streptomyces sp. NPDC049040]|uniref:hypothetical protein n=1 Tax=Streptomyces sp. NPDC049040 TaxID=3365593 RepID=UPI00371720B4